MSSNTFHIIYFLSISPCCYGLKENSVEKHFYDANLIYFFKLETFYSNGILDYRTSRCIVYWECKHHCSDQAVLCKNSYSTNIHTRNVCVRHLSQLLPLLKTFRAHHTHSYLSVCHFISQIYIRQHYLLST